MTKINKFHITILLVLTLVVSGVFGYASINQGALDEGYHQTLYTDSITAASGVSNYTLDINATTIIFGDSTSWSMNVVNSGDNLELRRLGLTLLNVSESGDIRLQNLCIGGVCRDSWPSGGGSGDILGFANQVGVFNSSGGLQGDNKFTADLNSDPSIELSRGAGSPNVLQFRSGFNENEIKALGDAASSLGNLVLNSKDELFLTLGSEADYLKLNNSDRNLLYVDDGNFSFGLGEISFNRALNQIEIGSASQALGDDSVAIGRYARTQAPFGVAIGSFSDVTLSEGIAIGRNSIASSEAVAVGSGAYAGLDSAVAIGFNSEASQVNSVALGANSQTTSANQVRIGSNSNPMTLSVTDEATVENLLSTGNISVGGYQIWIDSDPVDPKICHEYGGSCMMGNYQSCSAEKPISVDTYTSAYVTQSDCQASASAESYCESQCSGEGVACPGSTISACTGSGLTPDTADFNGIKSFTCTNTGDTAFPQFKPTSCICNTNQQYRNVILDEDVVEQRCI